MNAVFFRNLGALVLGVALLCLTRVSRAQTLQAPVGGAAIPVGTGLVACSAAGGWALEAGGALLRPPSAETAAGGSAVVRVAATFAACASTKQQLTLLATGRFPVFEPTSVGLASSTSTTGRSLTEVGVPVGLGLSIPIANRLSLTEASINLHGWVEFPISRQDHTPAFIFGPSISIGNIGANL
jgi:hypothetical protein